ncbi:MAG: amidohydrolase family protein [Acidobacteriota bacterium]|nr:amidohydrolase family protein [Acidobacteriota bacterium]
MRLPTLRALVLSVAVSASPVAAQSQTSPIAITDVTVIDGTGRPAQPHMTVIIANGRIVDLGRTGTLKPRAGAQILDGTGKFAIPGLWNMHVHALNYEHSKAAFPALLAAGVTGVRDMGAPLDDVLRLRTETASRVLTGPHITTPGPLLVRAMPPDMTGSKMLRVVTSSDEASDAVSSLKTAGADFIEVEGSASRTVYLAVAVNARRQHIPFAGHIPPSITAREASEAGQRSVEHLGGPHHAVLLGCSDREAEQRQQLAGMYERGFEAAMRGQDPEPEQMRANVTKAILGSFSDIKARALFDRFRRNRTWQVPTLVALRGLWRQKGLTAEDLEYGERIQQKQLDVVGAMARAGVRIMAGTDGPMSQAGAALHDELVLLVKAGLTPMQALQAATRSPAEFMRRLRDFGTIERGRVADIVLLDANPLDDITNTRRVSTVMLGGNVIGNTALR